MCPDNGLQPCKGHGCMHLLRISSMQIDLPLERGTVMIQCWHLLYAMRTSTMYLAAPEAVWHVLLQEWMLGQDFGETTKCIVARALHGISTESLEKAA